MKSTMLVSVLLAFLLVQNSHSKNLPLDEVDDMSNELTPSFFPNYYDAPKRTTPEWVKIRQAPEPVVFKSYGSKVELECTAMGSPPPTIQWYKHNTKLTENDLEFNHIEAHPDSLAKVTSKLVINYLLPRHEDMYRCVATSGKEEASALTKVIVENTMNQRDLNFTQLLQHKILGGFHQPKITYFYTVNLDAISWDTVLPCRTVGNPKPSLMWLDPLMNEVPRDESQRVHVLRNGDLKITNIEWNDMGNYVCVVKNKLGEDRIETFVYPMASTN
ncbi:unnamed protein product [Brassicogethes aeneus]|uniref:Ig-like domain-containing protein n=1 Tax=Brassicogethes aeneus TaxID=1431903 RepID=A0A9P0AU80_BRAAE|nr:unnamed protein product [Brassicogethes aeneus]